MSVLAFIIIFVVTVGSALLVAFSRNLIYSAFALIGTFIGVAGSFILLQSEFLGLAQIMIYAGGILVLTIFAVMLTARIDVSAQTNPVGNKKVVIPAVLILLALMTKVAFSEKWLTQVTEKPVVSSQLLGDALLGKYVLAFELLSVVLLMAMIGAAIITRRYVKEQKD